jgi:MFS transporter, UMF1 family
MQPPIVRIRVERARFSRGVGARPTFSTRCYAPAMTSASGHSRAVWSWAIYDLANTIFYGVVVTMYLPGYVKGLTGGAYTPYSLAFLPAMILGAFAAPWLGAWADRSGKARAGVLAATVFCALASCGLALADGATAVLVTFALALLAYNVALVLYNTLLPHVARDATLARVSGLGVGLGYLGNVIAFPLAAFVVARADGDARAAFVLAGVLFLVFTAPLAFACPDPPVRSAAQRTGDEFTALRDVLRRCLRDRGLFCFFAGNFLCADALNAAYGMMVPFIEDDSGLGLAKTIPMLALNVVAVPAAIGMGFIGDRTAPKPVMIAGAISFLLAVAIPQALIELANAGALPATWMADDATPPWKLVAASALVICGAIGVGGVLGAARKWICRLTPPAEHGVWFGLYGFTNKLSLIGLVAFTALHDRRGDYRGSVLFLACELGVACVLLAAAPRERVAAPRERVAPVEAST